MRLYAANYYLWLAYCIYLSKNSISNNIGQPEISILLDEEWMALYGVTKADAQAVVEMAIGGKTATTKYEGEKKFDIRIRYAPQYRKNEGDIMRLMIPL